MKGQTGQHNISVLSEAYFKVQQITIEPFFFKFKLRLRGMFYVSGTPSPDVLTKINSLNGVELKARLLLE